MNICPITSPAAVTEALLEDGCCDMLIFKNDTEKNLVKIHPKKKNVNTLSLQRLLAWEKYS